jgi:hypothetical protein
MKFPRALNFDYHGEAILQWMEERGGGGNNAADCSLIVLRASSENDDNASVEESEPDVAQEGEEEDSLPIWVSEKGSKQDDDDVEMEGRAADMNLSETVSEEEPSLRCLPGDPPRPY